MTGEFQDISNAVPVEAFSVRTKRTRRALSSHVILADSIEGQPLVAWSGYDLPIVQYVVLKVDCKHRRQNKWRLVLCG